MSLRRGMGGWTRSLVYSISCGSLQQSTCTVGTTTLAYGKVVWLLTGLDKNVSNCSETLFVLLVDYINYLVIAENQWCHWNMPIKQTMTVNWVTMARKLLCLKLVATKTVRGSMFTLLFISCSIYVPIFVVISVIVLLWNLWFPSQYI